LYELGLDCHVHLHVFRINFLYTGVSPIGGSPPVDQAKNPQIFR
jgi:hypothetical protein